MVASEELKEQKRVIILLVLVAILLTVIVMLSIFYIRATHPMAQAKREAVKIAEEYTELETVDNFYWFNRKETYFTVTGKDASGKEIIVVVPEKSGNVTVLNQEDGISEDQAKQMVAQSYKEEEIQKANLGLFDGEVVWEIVAKSEEGPLNYYLITFKEGKEVNVIQNI
ncbi:DUF5590 domain-containing protein [Enterococcus sp. BWT-B8]|nr:DUF5590 domain-containing protein [Enterococcus sp. BWT-B8]MCB5952612.1 DUF5590 domain-containing protein [Enterococcus sp. BWT-B8]